MNFNPRDHLSALERTVSFVERDGHPASEVSLSRSYATTIEDLWNAVTCADRVPLWFAPVTGDLRPGGYYQLEGNAGGTIMACEPLSHFTLTWEFGGDISWVSVNLSDDRDRGARLSLTHTARISEHWDEFGPGAVGVGWEMGFLGLALHLARPDKPKSDDEQFATSLEGRSFILGSSEGWMNAAISAGTDAAEAEQAAKRTASFYTGESMEAQ